MLFHDVADGHLFLEAISLPVGLSVLLRAWKSHLPGDGITPPEVRVLPLNPKDLKMKHVCMKYNLTVCGSGIYIVVIIWKDERNGEMKI